MRQRDPALLAALDGVISAGEVRIVIRHRRGGGATEGQLLARLGLIAALDGRWFDHYLPGVVGIAETADSDAVWRRANAVEGRQSPRWPVWNERFGAVLDHLQAADEVRLSQLGTATGPTPQAAVVRAGRVIGTLGGYDVTAEQVLDLVAD